MLMFGGLEGSGGDEGGDEIETTHPPRPYSPSFSDSSMKPQPHCFINKKAPNTPSTFPISSLFRLFSPPSILFPTTLTASR